MTDSSVITHGNTRARIDTLAQRRLGATGPITDLQVVTAGANKSTWSFDAPSTNGRARYILQRQALSSSPNPDSATDDWMPQLSGAEEFEVMRAAHAAGVPVPGVSHILEPADGLGDGAVTERVDGESLPARVLRLPELAPARARMASQCGGILASIHQLPTAPLSFLQAFDAETMLALFERTLVAVDLPLPALELGLRWARARVPRPATLTVVHGDFRTGNFIVGSEGIRAVIDWEIAHLGDPLEDLGYLCMRTWRFGGAGPVGGFGEREQLFEGYEAASGVAVDPAAVRFWEAMSAMRWTLGCVRRAYAWRYQTARKLEFAAIGRRIEEPILDLLDVIDGRN